jgi:hypothetical protein
MTDSAAIIEPCPKCRRSVHVHQKLLLIDKFNDEHFVNYPNERTSCPCEGDMSVDALRPEFVRDVPLEQFVTGLYCEACGIGFIPERLAKPRRQSWKLSKDGWHRVNSDGSLGPPQKRIDEA